MVRAEGTETLTLGRLAERSGVTKPVVYDHFDTRQGLLAALYRDYDARQTALMDAALQASRATLRDRAAVIASSYVDCVMRQGREIPGVIAALAGSPELEKIKREYEVAFIGRCRDALGSFAGADAIAAAGLWAMLGAAEGLSRAAVLGEIPVDQAREELRETILSMAARSSSRGSRSGAATARPRR